MAQMPRGEPFSVPDPLAGAWDAMVRLNRRLQAKNDPLAQSHATATGRPRLPAASSSDEGPAAITRFGAERHGTGPLLGVISEGEGTNRPDGYDMTYNYADGVNYPRGWKKPTQLTIDQAIGMEADARRAAGDYAIGKYQFKPNTLRELKGRMSLKGSEVMTPEMQDRMAETLLAKRGYHDFTNGRITDVEFQKRLSREWASLAEDQNDRSHYKSAGKIVPTAVLRPAMRQSSDAAGVLNQYLDGGYLPPP